MHAHIHVYECAKGTITKEPIYTYVAIRTSGKHFLLYRERVAAELIVTELQYQRHSVELPTAAPMKIKSLALTNQSYVQTH